MPSAMADNMPLLVTLLLAVLTVGVAGFLLVLDISHWSRKPPQGFDVDPAAPPVPPPPDSPGDAPRKTLLQEPP